MKGTAFTVAGASRRLPAVKVPRQCPLVLLAKVDWKEVKAVGKQEGKVLGR